MGTNLALGLVAGVLWGVGLVDAAGNAQVFDLRDNLLPLEYSVMLTIVIVALVLFDLIVESYEHYLHHHKDRFHQKLFNKAVKELMILGLISFVLFLLKDQKTYDQSDDVLTNTFDFVNLFLFFVGISFVVAAVLMVCATSPFKDRWDTYANVPLQRLLDLHDEMISHSWKWYLAWPPRYFTGLRQAQVLEYHLFRSVFLRLNRSLLTPAFDFSKYSAAVVDDLIVVFFDVGWASWLFAVVALYFTVPITQSVDGSESVSVQGDIVFGFALIVVELLVCAYCHHAHQKVCARMGVVGGFKGVKAVLEELWVEPQHHMGQETAAIDVKDLLLAAPGKAPTLEQLTSEFSTSGLGVSHAEVNFRAHRGSASFAASTMRRGSRGSHAVGNENGNGGVPSKAATTSVAAGPPQAPHNDDDVAASTASNVSKGGGNGHVSFVPVAVDPTHESTKSPVAVSVACVSKGPGCTGCADCDPLWLPPGRVQNCAMGGDPFVLAVLRPPQRVVDALPGLLTGWEIKVGSHWWFKTLFGMCTLLKCYYSAFYFSYAIGRAIDSASTLYVVMWIFLTPCPMLICLLPLAKRTLPLFAQLACLQGQINWELVSDIEEKQEMAARAREEVVEKLRGTLGETMSKHMAEGANGGGGGGRHALSLAIDDLFTEWDKNGDNKISKDELARGLNDHGVYLSTVQLKELFRLADPDHSKSIDPVEFRDFLSGLQSLENEPEVLARQLAERLQRRSIAEDRHSRMLRAADECHLLSSSSPYAAPAAVAEEDSDGAQRSSGPGQSAFADSAV